MDRSLWARYKDEMHGLQTIEESWGLAAFILAPDCIFIDEFYVVPEVRKQGLGLSLLHRICEIARAEGKKFIRSSVSLESRTAHGSICAQLASGFRIVKAHNEQLLLELALED